MKKISLSSMLLLFFIFLTGSSLEGGCEPPDSECYYEGHLIFTTDTVLYCDGYSWDEFSAYNDYPPDYIYSLDFSELEKTTVPQWRYDELIYIRRFLSPDTFDDLRHCTVIECLDDCKCGHSKDTSLKTFDQEWNNIFGN